MLILEYGFPFKSIQDRNVINIENLQSPIFIHKTKVEGSNSLDLKNKIQNVKSEDLILIIGFTYNQIS